YISPYAHAYIRESGGRVALPSRGEAPPRSSVVLVRDHGPGLSLPYEQRLTLPPAWRSRRPAISSSSSASCTAEAPSPDWRISSSTETGAVVRRPAMSAGSCAAGSPSNER